MPNSLSFTPALTLTRLNSLLSELGGRVNYVDRGDPSTYDWDQAALTKDGTWYDLNCAAIVPVNAKAVHIKILFRATAASKSISFRKKGNTGAISTLMAMSQVANVYNVLDGLVACDSDRTIQYNLDIATWSFILIHVRGWLI